MDGNPILLNDPLGNSTDDWIYNPKTKDYTFDEKVTSYSNTPEGFDYVGDSRFDVAEHLLIRFDHSFNSLKGNTYGEWEGHSDGGNYGTITDQEMKIGFGLLGSFSGIGAIAEGAFILGGIALVNGADDVFSNKEGESLAVQQFDDESTKDFINTLKLGASFTTFSGGVISLTKAPSFIDLVGTLSDGTSLTLEALKGPQKYKFKYTVFS